MKFNKYIKESASLTTTLQESLHCVGLGIIQLTGKNLSEVVLLNGDLFTQSYDKFCDVDVGLDTIYTFAKEKPSWVKAVVNNCNSFANSKWSKSKKYTFYRSNGIMRDVYATFNLLKTKEKIKINNDKWNPGDIWVSTLSNIPNFDTLSEYNNWISSSLNDGTLMGISLKKSKGIPKVEYVDQGTELPTLTFKGVKPPKGMFNTGIDILVNGTKNYLNVRSFTPHQVGSITTEILVAGGSARHGKSTPSKEIKKFNIPQMSKSDIMKHADNYEYMNNMISTLWNDLGYRFSESDKEKQWAVALKKNKSIPGFYRSLINSLQFGVYLTQNKKVADEIVSRLMLVASSRGDYSSDFIKIY